jgi:hypothetical protein
MMNLAQTRMTVLDYIKDLETKSMIYGKKERPDSQSFMMYVNKDNILSSVFVELEEFKKSYVNLLEKSKELINNKDYSINTVNTEALGIKQIDPAKWSYNEISRYNEFWDNKMKENLRDSLKLQVKLDKLMKEGKELKNQILGQMQMGNKEQVLQDIQKYESIERQQTSFLGELQYVIGSLRENILLLFLGPVKLFYVVVDIMFFRSIIRWQDKISDKEVLSQLYSIAYKKVAEIQFELSKFFQSLEFGRFDPVRTLVRGRYETENIPAGFWVLVSFYHQINMDSEIRRTINSLIKLNEEIKELNLFDLSLDYYPPDMLENMRKEIREDMRELYKLAVDIRKQQTDSPNK